MLPSPLVSPRCCPKQGSSHSSGTPLLFTSWLVPASISHQSGTLLLLQSAQFGSFGSQSAISHTSSVPFVLQSLHQGLPSQSARSHSSGMVFVLQSALWPQPGRSHGPFGSPQSMSHSSGMAFPLQSGRTVSVAGSLVAERAVRVAAVDVAGVRDAVSVAVRQNR